MANGFEHSEPAMSFVEVQNAGSNAQGAEGSEPANAEQQLLANANASIASVEPRGEFAILRSVAFDIRIKKEKVTAADLYAPHAGTNAAATGLNMHGERQAIGRNRRFHRNIV